jgi:hypothetical protein
VRILGLVSSASLCHICRVADGVGLVERGLEFPTYVNDPNRGNNGLEYDSRLFQGGWFPPGSLPCPACGCLGEDECLHFHWPVDDMNKPNLSRKSILTLFPNVFSEKEIHDLVECIQTSVKKPTAAEDKEPLRPAMEGISALLPGALQEKDSLDPQLEGNKALVKSPFPKEDNLASFSNAIEIRYPPHQPSNSYTEKRGGFESDVDVEMEDFLGFDDNTEDEGDQEEAGSEEEEDEEDQRIAELAREFLRSSGRNTPVGEGQNAEVGVDTAMGGLPASGLLAMEGVNALLESGEKNPLPAGAAMGDIQATDDNTLAAE